MIGFAPLIPRQPVPDLKVSTVNSGTWKLADLTLEKLAND
jgi:hypothetical protein